MKTVITAILCMSFLLIVGCGSDQSPTEVTAPDQPGILKDQPPMTGATILRYDDFFAVTYVDIVNNLRVVFGVDMELFCNDIFEPDIVSIMDIVNPNDQNLVNELLRGEDLQCWVYPLTPFDCEIFLAEGPIATGYVDLVSTDNDFYAFLEERTANRVNSFGTTANGTLYTPAGQKVLFNFTYRTVWTGYPDLAFINQVSKINLAVRQN